MICRMRGWDRCGDAAIAQIAMQGTELSYPTEILCSAYLRTCIDLKGKGEDSVLQPGVAVDSYCGWGLN